MATGSDAEKSLIHASQVPPQRPVPEASIVAPSAQPAFCPHRPPSFFSRILTQRPRPLFLSNPPQVAENDNTFVRVRNLTLIIRCQSNAPASHYCP